MKCRLHWVIFIGLGLALNDPLSFTITNISTASLTNVYILTLLNARTLVHCDIASTFMCVIYLHVYV